MPARLKALVVGGGIGGLAAALALHRAGLEVVVFERASQMREVAAGLVLWPNAIKALETLGLGGAVRGMGVAPAAITFRNRRGRRLIEVSKELLTERYGEPGVCVHRAEFLWLLYEALPREVVRLGTMCNGFMQGDTEVRALIMGGGQESGQLLVGADGLYSTVRDQLWPPRQPRYSGYTVWRAITHVPLEHLTPGETWGRGTRFGQMPMTFGRVYWYAMHAVPEGQSHQRGEGKRMLLDLFQGWHKPIPQIIAATEEGAILRHDAYDRPPLAPWGAGRVTLLGDAAHPMTPDLSQGACQALEDVAVLSRCILTRPDNVALALRDYESLRMDRTARILRQSHGMAQKWLHGGALGTLARHAGMKLPGGRRRLLRHWDGLMGFSV